MTGAAKNTITKLLVDLGEACADYQDGVLVDLPCKVVEADEIWAYCYAKQKNVPEDFKGTYGYGDVWTFTAIWADTKLIPSWLVGERTSDDAEVFLSDLASRMAGRIQLSTDGHKMYEATVGPAFSHRVDWAQIHKTYASPTDLGQIQPASLHWGETDSAQAWAWRKGSGDSFARGLLLRICHQMAQVPCSAARGYCLASKRCRDIWRTSLAASGSHSDFKHFKLTHYPTATALHFLK